MKAINLQLKPEVEGCLEAIVLIECQRKENLQGDMNEIASQVFDALAIYDGEQKSRDVVTKCYDPTSFYVKTSGIPDYIWFVLKTVMERHEFRFSKPYSEFINFGHSQKFLSDDILADFTADQTRNMELETQKQKAVAQERFEDASVLKKQQRVMRKKVYVPS